MIPAGIEVACLTDKGRQREHNEDIVGHFDTPNGYVFVVCDGLGGHEKGEIASQMTLRAIMDYFSGEIIPDPVEALKKAIAYANEQVIRHQLLDKSAEGMGTTIVIGLYRDDKIYYAHVGDSRIYLFSPSTGLEQLTLDHSYVQELINRGILTPEEAVHHPRRHVIMRAIGSADSAEPSIGNAPIQLKPGQIVLMCSDGLTGMLTDEEISNILKTPNQTLQQLTQILTDHANQAGGNDNITSLLIKKQTTLQ